MRMIRWGSTFTAAAMVVWVVVATACRGAGVLRTAAGIHNQ